MASPAAKNGRGSDTSARSQTTRAGIIGTSQITRRWIAYKAHGPTSAMCCIAARRTVGTKTGGIAVMKKTRRFCGLLSRDSGDVSAVDSQNSPRRLARERKADKRFRNVLGQNLAAQKIAGEIAVFAYPACLRAFLDQPVGQ